MLILGLDCSTSLASVAVAQQTEDHYELLSTLSSPLQKSHSEFINPAIATCLQQAGKSVSDIDLLAVTLGPGSFTGVRTAINIIRTFSYLLHKAVFTMNSLELLNCNIPAESPRDCLTILNAYKNMVYLCVFENGKEKFSPQALPAIELENHLHSLGLHRPLLCLGDGYDAYKKLFSTSLLAQLQRDPQISDHPQAAQLTLQAAKQLPSTWTLDWKSIIPLYLRASSAEENVRTKTI